MIRVAVAMALGALALAQQPRVQQEELAKPGQSQPAQPAKPAPKAEPKAPAAQTPPPAQPAPAAAPPPAAPAPQPTAAVEKPKPAPTGQVQHTPENEERERGQAGKPVAAFWTVLPGR